jgi:hypothetical protein
VIKFYQVLIVDYEYGFDYRDMIIDLLGHWTFNIGLN